MQDMISIIVPVYNRELYVEECVRSLLEQNYTNIQVILIDDGSEDRSLDICNRLALEDHRVKVIAMEHGGVSKARNLGLDEATGTYIFFIDSDDIVHPQTLENLLLEIKKYNVALALVEGRDIKQENWETEIITECMSVKQFQKVKLYSNQEAIAKLFNNRELFGRIGGYMIKSEYLGSTRFSTDIFLGEDVRFMYENLLKGSDAVVLSELCYYWRTHPAKISRDISANGFLSRMRCKAFLWRSEESLGRKNNAQVEKRSIYQVFLQQMTLCSLCGKESKTIRSVMKQYRQEIVQDLEKRERIHLALALNVPFLYFLPKKIKLRLKKNREKRQQNQ